MSAGTGRLPPPAGSRIDRTRPIEFFFEDQRYAGLAGDSIASALAANGVWLLSRSFKLHRPRGAMTMAGEDAGSLVQVGAEPNVPADMRPIEPGLQVHGQNYVGSLRRDAASVLERFNRFLPVGFYYRAFYKPRGIWNWWEKLIRRTAGLGWVDTAKAPDYYDKTHDWCDVAVVGGGPAGLAAAAEAARAGAEVLLMERGPDLGGALTHARFDSAGERGSDLLAQLRGELAAQSNVRVMTHTTCTGLFEDRLLAAIRGNRLFKVRAQSVAVCTGAIEQPAVFRNNDLPRVLMGSAAQRLVKHFAVRPGERVVVLTANEDGYGAALDLADAGMEVAAIVELRADASGPLARTALERGLRVMPGHTVREAIPGSDGQQVESVLVTRVTGQGESEPDGETIACDALCVSVGSTPAASLLAQAGARFEYDESSAMLSVKGLPSQVFAAGSVASVFDIERVVASGRQAGRAAARSAGFEGTAEPARAPAADADPRANPWPIFPHPRGLDFVDLDEDLQVEELNQAIEEGFESMELLKRFSSLGMGPSQGRLSSPASIRLAAKATGNPTAETRPTTTRPPTYPEKFGHLAGRGFAPVRRTALHHRHVEAGAQMMVQGLWIRPAFYGPAHEREASIREEVLTVRRGVGIIDVGTLGGFDIRGPDAPAFMDRFYTLGYRRLRVGRVRYTLMASEDGVILDDGVAARLGRGHYYVTTSTSGAEEVYPLYLQHNAQWALKVDIADVTSAYCGINLAGPQARAVLAKLTTDIDVSPQAFPYLGVRTGAIAGIPARLLRIGFLGELAYEIHAPAAQAEALWDALLEAGREFGIRPFGVEAQRVLRLEKGHIIVGQDTDGLTNPLEAGLEWALNGRKPFYLGKRSIEIAAQSSLTRKLVGYTLGDEDAAPPAVGHLVVRDGEIVGRVTSSAWSPSLGCAIGLAYVQPDQAASDQRFTIKGAGGRLLEAKVRPVPFYDPANVRQET